MRDPFPATSGKNSPRSRRIKRRGALQRKGERNSRIVPPFPGSPRCLSPFRETCFPCTASTFKPGSTHTTVARGTALWESLVGNPRGKDSRESHRSLDPREGKGETAATAREESARACPHSRRGLTPKDPKTPEGPQDPGQHWRIILSLRPRLHKRS